MSTTAVPKAVPSAVAPSAANTVPVLTEPQRQPYLPASGNKPIPVVPRTEVAGEPSPQPGFGHAEWGMSDQFFAGSSGAPSVPVNGFLFKRGPVDEHYTAENEGRNPYAKVNNPPTRGMFTFIKEYLNHIAGTPQYVDANGFRISDPQQRTSVMRVTPPPHGGGFAPETYEPRQMPQRENVYKYPPAIGTGPFGRKGTSVLNSATFGAGQTAGGIGGSNYTPQPGPPPTTSTSGSAGSSDMPTWG
jgi:hypothetical protein